MAYKHVGKMATVLTLMLIAPFASIRLAQADTPNAQVLIQRMKEAFEPSQPTLRKVRITMRANGEKVEWIAGQAFKHLPDGTRMLLVILEPPELRGSTYLVQTPDKTASSQTSVMWVYTPGLRRTRILVPVDAYEHFFGTDFTYADLGFVRLHESYRLLGEEEHLGRQTYKIEEISPQERAYYSRLITWVTTDTMLPLQRNYYDVKGELWKTERFVDEVMIDGIPTLLHVMMQDVQGKTSTELTFDQIRYDTDVPDSLFNPKHLAQAEKAPLWQTYLTAAPDSQ